MAYGTIKVDNITFTNDGIDQNVTVSGIVQSISGNLTATGTLQGSTIIGTTIVSGATVTGNIGQFTTLTGGTAAFTAVTGITVTGTTVNFISGVFTAQVSGATITGNAAQFTTLTGGTAGFTTVTGTTITGNAAQFTTLTGGTAGFTTVTGTTVTGTTANFATLSGTTITGGHVTTASGTYTGNVIAAAFVPTSSTVPTNGLYLPSTNNVALATNGTGRLFVDSSGQLFAGQSAALSNVSSPRFELTGDVVINTTTTGVGTEASLHLYHLVSTGTATRSGAKISSVSTGSYTAGSAATNDSDLTFSTTINGVQSERLRITSDGKVGVGTSSPDALFTVNGVGAYGLGSAAAPSFAFTGDLNTGLWSPTADTIAASTAGSERLRITSAGLVGVGTSSPGALLDIAANNDGVTGTTANNTLRFTDTDTNTIADQPIGKIEWYSADTSTPGARAVSYIMSSAAGVNSGGDIRFGISASAGTATEAARIDSSGRLLVGTSSTFDLNATVQSVGTGAYRFEGFRFGTDNGILILGSANGTQAAPSVLTSPNLGLGIIQFRSYDGAAYRDGAWISATAESQWASGDCPTRLVFSTTADGASSPTERLRITSAGLVGIGTTNPTEPLNVARGADDLIARFGSLTTNTGAWIRLQGKDAAGTSNQFWDIRNNVDGSLSFNGNTSSLTERARIDSSGRLLVGTSTARANFQNSSGTAALQVEGTSQATSAISLVRNSATLGPIFRIARSAGATVGSNTLLTSADPEVGVINFEGNDGSEFVIAAQIKAEVDGTPGADDMPGRLVFSTTADGSASPTERLRITSAGVLQIADAGNISVGTTTGTKIGTATTQKLGFYNKTPVVQPTAVADATDAASVITQLNALLSRMRDLGLIAT